MASDTVIDLQAIIDGLGHGVLIFDKDGNLKQDNLAARTLLGKDIRTIRSSGWTAVSTLFNTKQTNPDNMIEAVRDRALESERPVRFFTYLGGQYVPCWMSATQGESGDVNLMITLDAIDWSALKTLLDKFRDEMKDAIMSTQGHIDIINKTIDNHKPDEPTDVLARRIGGFTELISTHMSRVSRLMSMLERLEDIRTGKIREIIKQRQRKIVVEDYLEDFIEELDEFGLVDPETDAHDHRSRIEVNIEGSPVVSASSLYLTHILQELIRNAIMYSMKASPIKIKVQAKNNAVQFDVTDEGYGIREKEIERIFVPFERARQPQIIAEFGYGLCLHICKNEVSAMNGRMWFESQEKVGSTFSFTLPLYQEVASDSSLSSSDSSEDTKAE